MIRLHKTMRKSEFGSNSVKGSMEALILKEDDMNKYVNNKVYEHN